MGTSAALTPVADQADLPRSIRRGPPITIGCECGERRDLHYGDRWTCEKCGKTWDTGRIPVDEYAQLCRTQARFRWIPLAGAVFVVASLIALVLLGRAFSGILLAALAATAWSTFGRPQWKRRYLKAIENRPSWDIKSE
ncbi:MAG TPA: hypothetical protein VGI55_06360 [Solirubrobacteraceae bacterium]|jgi:hypothetical protein